MATPEVTASGLRASVTDILNNGTPIRIRYYTGSAALTGYDDNIVLSKSGSDVWTSGLAFSVAGLRGADVGVLLQQGRILSSDNKVFINGNVSLSGECVKIGLGSPTVVEYFPVKDSIRDLNIGEGVVYHDCFVRLLPGGSFYGESA